MNTVLDQKINAYRGQLDEIVKELHEITGVIGHNDLEKTVGELRSRIKEPFMFVIVGEVKAGKSSFVNALLDPSKEICKVAPQPMTDTIQQIVYGEEEKIEIISPYLKRIFQPVEILKEIAIVDTPGTNTIADHHQEITENFIPASDLIVFVFESKNPYRQSAWDFFNYIHKEWHRKVIFVLQQKDLMVPADLVVNINGVKEYAIKKGISNPNVFVVSAKMEIEHNLEESGFKDIRSYIADNITGGKAPFLKLENIINTSRNINTRIYNGVQDRMKQLQADKHFRLDIKESLAVQEKKSAAQVDVLVENILASYDNITRKKEAELEEGLNFFTLIKRSFGSFFTKQKSAKVWLAELSTELETELNATLKSKLNNGVVDIADSIQQMAKMIDLKIKNSDTVLKDDHELFSEIAERRINVLRELQETFKEFMEKSENFTESGLFPDQGSMGGNFVTGSGIAVIGMILTSVTNISVVDVTGGILTAVGLVFAGGSISFQKRKVLKGYQKEIANGRQILADEVSHKLKTYITSIKNKIDSNFVKFDHLIETEEKQINYLNERYETIENKLGKIEVELEEM